MTDLSELRKQFYTCLDEKEPFGNEYHDELFAWMVVKIESERNKTIDEAIDIVTDYQDYNPLIIERLKALKV